MTCVGLSTIKNYLIQFLEIWRN